MVDGAGGAWWCVVVQSWLHGAPWCSMVWTPPTHEVVHEVQRFLHRQLAHLEKIEAQLIFHQVRVLQGGTSGNGAMAPWYHGAKVPVS